MSNRLVLVVLFLAGCSHVGLAPPKPLGPATPLAEWPNDWSRYLDQTVTVEGKTYNTKLGALLEGAQGRIWIDNLDAWPEGFYRGEGQAKRVRVTGTVIRRDDMPVFYVEDGKSYFYRDGELREENAVRGILEAGIPVDSIEELERARWRFLLKDAYWVEVE